MGTSNIITTTELKYLGSLISWFSCGSSILVELKFLSVGFCGGRKTGESGTKPSEQGENQQMHTTYGTNQGLIEGRRAF